MPPPPNLPQMGVYNFLNIMRVVSNFAACHPGGSLLPATPVGSTYRLKVKTSSFFSAAL